MAFSLSWPSDWALCGSSSWNITWARRINYLYGTKPIPIIAFLGLLFLFLSLRMADLASAVLGIVGVTTLWDAVELYRQEERVRSGQAPANPDRPVKPNKK